MLIHSLEEVLLHFRSTMTKTSYAGCLFFRAVVLLLLAARQTVSFVPMTPRHYPFTDSQTTSPTQLNGAAVSAVETFFLTKPYMAAFLTCSVKASAADWIAQQQQEEYNLDVSRNVAFLVYGGLYSGMAQQFMYTTIFPNMFGNDLDWVGLASQVSFDMLCVGPLLCLPLCYTVKSLVCSNNGGLQQGLEKYVHDVTTQGLLLKYWGLWTPGMLYRKGKQCFLLSCENVH